MPQSKPGWWKDAAINGFIRHDKKPDGDNVQKQFCDALEKLQFVKNDSQIFFSETIKAYSDKPRWEIRIVINPNITRKEWLKYQIKIKSCTSTVSVGNI